MRVFKDRMRRLLASIPSEGVCGAYPEVQSQLFNLDEILPMLKPGNSFAGMIEHIPKTNQLIMLAHIEPQPGPELHPGNGEFIQVAQNSL